MLVYKNYNFRLKLTIIEDKNSTNYKLLFIHKANVIFIVILISRKKNIANY